MTWLRYWCLLLLPGLAWAVVLPVSIQVPYTPGMPLVIDASAVDIAYVTITGTQPVQFAAPTGGTKLKRGQVLKMELTASETVPVSWAKDGYAARYGLSLPTTLAGSPVPLLLAWQYDLTSKTWGLIASNETAPLPIEPCQIVIGSTEGAILTDTAYLRPGICNVPGAATVVEVVLSVDTGTPAVLPSKQSGPVGAELLTSAPLQMPVSQTLVCVRALAEKGLAGIACQAGLVNTSIPDGAWALGVSGGTAAGATRQAVVTIYYALLR